VEDFAIWPETGGDESLERTHGSTDHGLCNVLGVASVAATKQPLNEATRVGLIPVGPKERSEAVKEAIEFGLQCQELLLVHEQSLRNW
jgi:hypothetical protein